MKNTLTEGQRLYLKEEYEQALEVLKNELHDLDVDSETIDSRVHRFLIGSIKRETSFKGQAGILDFVSHSIEQSSSTAFEQNLLSLLMQSSNKGVVYISFKLQVQINNHNVEQTVDGVKPYEQAAKNIDNTIQFYYRFGTFLHNLAIEGSNSRENLKKAKELYERARAEGLEEGTSKYAQVLVKEGVAQQRLGEIGVRPRENLKTAKELYERARARGLEEGTPNYGKVLVKEGVIHQRLGEIGVQPRENYEIAKELYEQARAGGLEEDTPEYATALINQGDAHQGLGEIGVQPRENYETAKRLYERARTEGLEKDTRSYAAALVNQGIVQQRLGEIGVRPRENYETAKELQERARTEGLEKDTRSYAAALVNQGIVQQRLGEIGVRPRENYETAKELQERARTEILGKGTPDYARTLINQGNAHQRLGEIGVQPRENYEIAKELYERARTEGLEKDTPEYASALINQGNAHQRLGEIGVQPRENYETAKRLYERARTEGLEKGTRSYAGALMNQGNAQQKLGEIGVQPRENYETAKRLYERARTEGLEKGTRSYAAALMNQGIVQQSLVETGYEGIFQQSLSEIGEDKELNYSKTERMYIEARKFFDSINDYESLRLVDQNLACLNLSNGEKSKAYENYKNSIESIEEIRSTVKFREYRQDFFDEYISTYHDIVCLALDLGKSEEALGFAERAKGRIFLEMLESTHIAGDIPKQLAQREQKLKTEITQLRERLRPDGSERMIAGTSFDLSLRTGSFGSDAMSGLDRSASTTIDGELAPRAETVQKIQQIQNQWSEKDLFERLDNKKAEHIELLKEIRKRNPEAYTLKTVDVASLNEIQSALTPDEQVLEYVVTDDEILIFLLDEFELDHRKVSMSHIALHEGKDTDKDFNPLQEVVTEYRELVEPPGKGDLSRMQELGQVLYQALIEPVADTLEAENLLIVPHGTLHLLPFPALYDGESYLVEKHRLRLLANASSLRFLNQADGGHDREALVVGDPRGDLEYARAEAKEVAELYDSEVLIGDDATKREIEQRIASARISHLCCHGQYDPESPIHSSLLLAGEELLMEDIFNLDVGSELVTLSACETAIGEVTQGDEVKSLTRGFQYAGSPNVIGTLWRVDDESTRTFFRKFYNSDGDYATQLREVQMEFIREKEELAHPYYWSAFQVYGRE
ncbi:CHAT domain-containing protein [Halorubrum vacuolatum]|uniref:CHAT domain-containing protein n=2 Tax=Halorubrum vacuolatum TaxID=63740 RepID=A0A238YI01_HALVU|nr:CHAT domain-containing protein [Halorubrum vacuolatum]